MIKKHFTHSLKAPALMFFCLAFAGCEQKVSNPAWPEYQERMVLNAHLSITPDSTIITCNLGKTSPLNQPFDYKATRLSNATITVERDGDTLLLTPAMTPRYSSSADYNYRVAAETKLTQHYTIHAQWGQMNLQGSISPTVNVATAFDTFYIKTDSNHTDVHYCVYRLRLVPGYNYHVMFGKNLFRYSYKEEINGNDIPTAGAVVERVSHSLVKGTWYYSISATSMDYNDPYSHNSSDDPFGGDGSNPRHNVFGDGFGLFSYEVTGPAYLFEVK